MNKNAHIMTFIDKSCVQLVKLHNSLLVPSAGQMFHNMQEQRKTEENSYLLNSLQFNTKLEGRNFITFFNLMILDIYAYFAHLFACFKEATNLCHS